MNSALSTIAPAAEARTPRKAALPSFGALALAGFSANAPLASLGFLLGRSWLAISLLSGYVLGLLVYGLLYATVTRGFSASKSSGKRMPTGFALFMVGKFFVTGAALYILLCVLNMAAVWLLLGFLVTQAGVTASVMKHLTKTKVTD